MTVIDYRTQTAGQDYVLEVRNSSAAQFDFVFFLPVPRRSPDGTYPLVWFAHSLAASTSGYSTWQLTHALVWAETGLLKPGEILRPGQVLPAQLDSGNAAEVIRASGAYQFTNKTDGPPGKLTISPDGTIPASTVSVGIGMSGKATFAVQARPKRRVQFHPPAAPNYIVAASTSGIDTGQVLDGRAQSLTSHEVAPPANLYGAITELDGGNTWHVTYQSSLAVTG